MNTKSPSKEKVIRFYHADGFQDGTLYLEYKDNNIFIVSPTRRMEADSYDLKTCENLVKRGIWRKEVTE